MTPHSSREAAGCWWPAGAPGSALSGAVTGALLGEAAPPAGLRLTLEASAPESAQAMIAALRRPPAVLHGLLDGRAATAWTREAKTEAGTLHVELEVLLIGAHLMGSEDRRLQEAEMRLDGSQVGQVLVGAGPWTGSLPLGGDVSDSAPPVGTGQASDAGRSRILVERVEESETVMRLHILPSRAASVPEILEQLRSVTDLLAFAWLETSPALIFEARVHGDDGRLLDDYRVTCSAPGTHLGAGERARPRVGGPLFTSEQRPFEKLLEAWRVLRIRHRTSLTMLVAARALPVEFQEAALLVLLGSAEALYATSSGLRRREIKDSTLRRKLEHLADRVSFHEVMPHQVTAAVWAEQAARLRSTFTHSGRVDSGSRTELRHMAELTAGVVVLALLRELGIPAVEGRQRLRGHLALRDDMPTPRGTPERGRGDPAQGRPPARGGKTPTPRDVGTRPQRPARRAP
ncbi:HEPN domain-containing protein [Nesterenkonia sp. HG001]|uniref:HEPN domain-containing protein n=1 Tax=Nesterenkonia sp. HG001 TaxID=2983207 RepID=UPI002AC40CB2|nr:HEPN domain-containing protein [Nesterenkonia sp. HG001]MDZ5077456.1 hypothetical protein [Nesterenkonia sp. HG001]